MRYLVALLNCMEHRSQYFEKFSSIYFYRRWSRDEAKGIINARFHFWHVWTHLHSECVGNTRRHVGERTCSAGRWLRV